MNPMYRPSNPDPGDFQAQMASSTGPLPPPPAVVYQPENMTPGEGYSAEVHAILESLRRDALLMMDQRTSRPTTSYGDVPDQSPAAPDYFQTGDMEASLPTAEDLYRTSGYGGGDRTNRVRFDVSDDAIATVKDEQDSNNRSTYNSAPKARYRPKSAPRDTDSNRNIQRETSSLNGAKLTDNNVQQHRRQRTQENTTPTTKTRGTSGKTATTKTVVSRKAIRPKSSRAHKPLSSRSQSKIISPSGPSHHPEKSSSRPLTQSEGFFAPMSRPTVKGSMIHTSTLVTKPETAPKPKQEPLTIANLDDTGTKYMHIGCHDWACNCLLPQTVSRHAVDPKTPINQVPSVRSRKHYMVPGGSTLVERNKIPQWIKTSRAGGQILVIDSDQNTQSLQSGSNTTKARKSPVLDLSKSPLSARKQFLVSGPHWETRSHTQRWLWSGKVERHAPSAVGLKLVPGSANRKSLWVAA